MENSNLVQDSQSTMESVRSQNENLLLWKSSQEKSESILDLIVFKIKALKHCTSGQGPWYWLF